MHLRAGRATSEWDQEFTHLTFFTGYHGPTWLHVVAFGPDFQCSGFVFSRIGTDRDEDNRLTQSFAEQRLEPGKSLSLHRAREGAVCVEETQHYYFVLD